MKEREGGEGHEICEGFFGRFIRNVRLAHGEAVGASLVKVIYNWLVKQ